MDELYLPVSKKSANLYHKRCLLYLYTQQIWHQRNNGNGCKDAGDTSTDHGDLRRCEAGNQPRFKLTEQGTTKGEHGIHRTNASAKFVGCDDLDDQEAAKILRTGVRAAPSGCHYWTRELSKM